MVVQLAITLIFIYFGWMWRISQSISRIDALPVHETKIFDSRVGLSCRLLLDCRYPPFEDASFHC